MGGTFPWAEKSPCLAARFPKIVAGMQCSNNGAPPVPLWRGLRPITLGRFHEWFVQSLAYFQSLRSGPKHAIFDQRIKP